MNPRPSADLNAIAFSADHRIGIAVGSAGRIITTSDGGQSWHDPATVSSADIDFYGVELSGDGTAGWAVGSKGTILITANGGTTWHAPPVPSPNKETLRAVRFAADKKTGCAVGAAGTIVLTADGGDTWRPATASADSVKNDLLGLYLDAGGRSGWAVGASGTILRTLDAGEHWQAPGNDSGLKKVWSVVKAPGRPDLSGVFFSADQTTGWIVGEDETALLTEDGGSHWQLSNSDNSDLDPTYDEFGDDLKAVQFAADNKSGIAVGEGGVYRTSDGGQTWAAMDSGTEQTLYGLVLANDDKSGWAVGKAGVVVITKDGGRTWLPDIGNKGTYHRIQAVQFALDGLHGMVVGPRSTVLLTSDGGKSWRAPSGVMAAKRNLLGLHLTGDGRKGWAVGESGTILLTLDGGETWRPPSRLTHQGRNLNSVRFASNGASGCAVGAKGLVLVSADGGDSWRVVADAKASAPDLYGLALSDDGKNAWTVGERGTVLVSTDGCETWHPANGGSGISDLLYSVYFAADKRTGWAVGAAGAILLTENGGEHWHRAAEGAGLGRRLRFVQFGSDRLSGLIVGEQGTLLQSRDGGVHWSAPSGGTGTSLDIYAASITPDGRAGCAVGDAGTVICIKAIEYTPKLDTVSIKPSDNGTLTVLVHFSEGDGYPIQSAKLAVKGPNVKTWIAPDPEDFTRPTVAGGPWSLIWKPTQFPGGVAIDHQLTVDDGGPPSPPYELGVVVWEPWYTRVWAGNRAAIIAAAGILAMLALYLGAFGILLLVTPRYLAHLGPNLPDMELPSGMIGFLVRLLRSAVQVVALPWFVRRDRVRRAWLDAYKNGFEQFEDLGKVARQHFLGCDDVLDAWVEAHALEVRNALRQLELFTTRRLFVPAPVRRGEAGDAMLIEAPKPEEFRPMFGHVRNVVCIIGPGGAGKSTLACAIARWAMSDDPAAHLTDHRALPIIVGGETNDLLASVAGDLREMISPGAELPDDLVAALLARQRLLVIVDALSERDEATQRHIETLYRHETPINSLLITSRHPPALGTVERTELFPEPLRGKRLVSFIFDYLMRSKRDNAFTDREALSLGERILSLAEGAEEVNATAEVEAEGRAAAVTPLLAVLFVDSAISLAKTRGLPGNLPSAVPEIFLDYLRRLNPAVGPANTLVAPEDLERAACIAAECSLGNSLTPGDFRRDAALDSLRKCGFTAQAETVLDRLIMNGIIEGRRIAGLSLLRFQLDPAAEYLTAISKVRAFLTDAEAWTEYLTSVANVQGYPRDCEGYLKALEVCIRHYRKELRIPELALPWSSA
jgi:photosystem II stability/assembly factor-like uncharacterized protein